MLRNYTPDQAVEKLNLDIVELRFLVHHFSEFLTPSASAAGERTFTGYDLQLLGRIYSLLREEGNDPGNVRLQLRKELNMQPSSASRGVTFAFCSGRPGTGKSTLVFNLAAALAAAGHRVTIFDGSLGEGGIGRLIPAEIGQAGWHCVLPSRVHLVMGEKYLEAMEGGVADVAAMLESELAEINAASDFILVDTGAGRSDNALRYAMIANEIVVVTTPDVGANADCFAVIRMLKDIDPELHISLVIGRALNHGGAREVLSRINGAARKLSMGDIPGLGWISEDEAMRKCIANGESVFDALPTSMSARCVARLAEQIANRMNSDVGCSHGGLPTLVQALRHAMQRGAPSRIAF